MQLGKIVLATLAGFVLVASLSCRVKKEEESTQLESIKAIGRLWSEEIWNKGNLAAIDKLFAADFVGHYPGFPNPNKESYKQWAEYEFSVFSGISCTIEDMVAEGDRVVIRWTWRGTHDGGEYMGISPTGKHVTMSGTSILRIENGKIAEEWGNSDELGKLRQLGVVLPSGNAE